MRPDIPVPRDCSPIPALNPSTGEQWTLLIRHKKLDETAKRGMGAARELAHTVRQVVLHPTAVFKGVREEVEEEWLCYVGTPETAYNYRTGDARPAWEGEVFLVFVNDDRIVYNWRWEKADSRYRDLPLNFEDRFDQRVYPDDGPDF